MTCDKTRVCLIMGRHGRGRPTRRKQCRYSGVTVGRIITQKKDDQWASTVCIPQHVYIPPAARCMFTRRFKTVHYSLWTTVWDGVGGVSVASVCLSIIMHKNACFKNNTSLYKRSARVNSSPSMVVVISAHLRTGHSLFHARVLLSVTV